MVTRTHSRSRPIHGTVVFVVVLCWFSLFLLTSSTSRAQREPEKITPADFLLKYRQALKDVQATYRNVRIDGFAGRSSNTEFTYVESDGNKKLRLRRAKPEYFDRVLVNAGRRSFWVRRATPDGSYFLQNTANTDQEWPLVTDYRNRVAHAPFCPGGMGRFPEFVNSPEFKIQEASRTLEAGETLIRVAFQYLPTGKPELRGWILLDPAMNWVIRSYEFEVRGNPAAREAGSELFHSRTDGWVLYKLENGKRVPVEIQSRTQTNKQKDPWFEYFKISKFSFGSAPPEEFTLAAFGLGDFERRQGR